MENKGLKFEDIEERLLQKHIENLKLEIDILSNEKLQQIVNYYNKSFNNWGELTKTLNYIKKQAL